MWQQAMPVSAFAQRKFRDRRLRRDTHQACVSGRAVIGRSMSGVWRCAGAEGRPQRLMQIERCNRRKHPECRAVVRRQVRRGGGEWRCHRHRADEAGVWPAVMIVVSIAVVMTGMLMLGMTVIGMAQRKMRFVALMRCLAPMQVAERQHEAERQRKQRQACPELRSRSKPPHRSASDPNLVRKAGPQDRLTRCYNITFQLGQGLSMAGTFAGRAKKRR